MSDILLAIFFIIGLIKMIVQFMGLSEKIITEDIRLNSKKTKTDIISNKCNLCVIENMQKKTMFTYNH